jgi:AcrR family transcriptional regulator
LKPLETEIRAPRVDPRVVRSRAAVLEAASTLFLRDGYGPTSLERVADAAGYSKGAVYSNFRNKNQLCLAVLDAIHADQAELLGRAMAGAATVEQYLARFTDWAERNIGDQAWTALEVEFAVNARRDERVRDELASRSQGIRALIAGLVAQLAEEFSLDLPLSADDAATALLSLGIGLGIQRAIDPSVPVTVLTDVIRFLADRQRVDLDGPPGAR